MLKLTPTWCGHSHNTKGVKFNARVFAVKGLFQVHLASIHFQAESKYGNNKFENFYKSFKKWRVDVNCSLYLGDEVPRIKKYLKTQNKVFLTQKYEESYSNKCTEDMNFKWN